MGETWAGFPFLVVGLHDGRFFKGPGVYALVARDRAGGRTLLYVGHSDHLAGELDRSHPQWSAALGLGLNELHVNVRARERIDRLQIVDRVARRCEPLLNVLAQGEGAHPLPAGQRQRA